MLSYKNPRGCKSHVRKTFRKLKQSTCTKKEAGSSLDGHIARSPIISAAQKELDQGPAKIRKKGGHQKLSQVYIIYLLLGEQRRGSSRNIDRGRERTKSSSIKSENAEGAETELLVTFFFTDPQFSPAPSLGPSGNRSLRSSNCGVLRSFLFILSRRSLQYFSFLLFCRVPCLK